MKDPESLKSPLVLLTGNIMFIKTNLFVLQARLRGRATELTRLEDTPSSVASAPPAPGSVRFRAVPVDVTVHAAEVDPMITRQSPAATSVPSSRLWGWL